MKTTDLMIGDWVQVIRPVRPKECMARVIDIGEDGIWIMNNEGDEWFIHRNESFPIPLTPEILEKNGFVLTGKPGSSFRYECRLTMADDNQRTIEIDFHPKNLNCPYTWAWILYKRGFRSNDNAIEVKILDCCVHELQHALKLCGIDKEITI